MVLSRTDENELLTALHSGLFQPLPWRLFLTRLLARTEAESCLVHIRPAGDTLWHLVDEVRGRAVEADSFSDRLSAFDDLRPGRVYAGSELTPKARAHARYLRVAWPDGGDLVLAILRLKGDFRAREASLLASLAPHLAIALRSRMELEAAQRRADMAERALSSFSEGWLLLDGRTRVIDCDPGAARLLEMGTMIKRASDGRLRMLFPEAESLLEEAMAHRGSPLEPGAAWLGSDPPVQIIVMAPPDQTAHSLAVPHCLVLMRRMVTGVPADGRFLPALFGLTRSETALAEQVAGGASLAEAADALGLTIETARNYSKRVFLKTGARGQADLVRIVLNGVRLPR